MRKQVLEAFRSKHVPQNIFMPLMVHDFFESLPDYDKLLRADAKEFVDSTPSLAERFRYFLGMDGLRFRLAFGERIGAAFLGWCQGWALESSIDPSVTNETHVDGRKTTYVTKTPVGELVSKHEVSPISHVSYVTERPIKTVDDLKVLRYVTEATSHRPNYDSAPELQQAVGEAGVFTGGGFSCPFHDLLYSFEAEDFLVMSFDMPQEVRDMMDLLHAKNIEVVEILARSPFEVFDHETMWDARQISPKLHNEYYVPFQKDYNDIFHAAGKLCFDHASGQDVTPFLDGIEAADFDIMYGLHLGEENIDQMADLQKRWDGRIVGCPGPDPDYLCRMSADQVKQLCGDFLAKLGDRKVVMCSSDAMVPHTPVENLAAVTESLGLGGK